MSAVDIFEGDRVLGYVDFDDRVDGIYLNWTQVDEDRRGEGIREAVVRALLDRAVERGVPVYIDYVVDPPESYRQEYRTTGTSRAFYASLGFREVFRYGVRRGMERWAWVPSSRVPDFEGHVLGPASAREWLLLSDEEADLPATGGGGQVHPAGRGES